MRAEIDQGAAQAFTEVKTQNGRERITDEERRVPEGMLRGGLTEVQKPPRAKRSVFDVR
jgi:hypothetical protein